MTDRVPHVRRARPGDVGTILGFVRDLAVYEKLEHCLDLDADRLHQHLFGERPVCEALIGELESQPCGFALFFTSYSTFEMKPCLYLEDLYVAEHVRGRGLGRALLAALARLAAERDCPRLDWAVLDWNRTAIGFYETLGAHLLHDWRICRLEGDALRRLGAAEPSAPPGS